MAGRALRRERDAPACVRFRFGQPAASASRPASRIKADV
jgi:hypothetical protein